MKAFITKEKWKQVEVMRTETDPETTQPYTYKKIGLKLGIKYSTIESHFKRIREAKEIGLILNQTVKEPLTSEEIIKQEAENELEKQKAKTTKEEIKKASQNKIIVDQLIYCASITKPFPIKQLKIPELSGRSRNTTPILSLGDIHTGLHLKLSHTGGLNYYNKEKLVTQLENLKKALVIISIKQLAEYPLLKIHSLGDLLDGINIYKGQAFQQDMYLTEQYYYLAELMSTFLIELLQLYNIIEMKCVPGNHGRIGKKGESPQEDNFEYLWYRHMEQKMQNYPRIKWDISETWWMLDKTYDKTSLLFHGDGIRSWNSIPYYGIDRADAKYTKLLARQKDIYQILELGHFHSLSVLPTPTGNIVINGSFTGGSMLALKDMVTTSEPAQLFFGIHKDIPAINWYHPIYLDY